MHIYLYDFVSGLVGREWVELGDGGHDSFISHSYVLKDFMSVLVGRVGLQGT